MEIVSQRPQALLRRRRRIQRRDVRAVDFVPAEGVEVHAPVVHVYRAVRSVRHGVDAEQRAGDFVHSRCEGLDIVDGAEDVARLGASEELGLRREKFAEDGGLDVRVLLVDGFVPFQGCAPVGGELHPGRDVGFMVEFRDDDFAVRGDVVVERLGEVAEELGCRGAEDDFGGGGVDVFCHGLAAMVEEFGGFLGNRVAGAELDVVGGEVLHDSASMLARDLGGMEWAYVYESMTSLST